MTHFSIARSAGIIATGGLLLAVIVAPSAALATQPVPAHAVGIIAAEEPPAEEPPTDVTPTDDPTTGPMDDVENGEIVYDPTFIAPTPDATTPAGRVPGTASAPELTPPSTDTFRDQGTTTPGSGLQLVLLAVAGLMSLVLTAGRVPAARRS